MTLFPELPTDDDQEGKLSFENTTELNLPVDTKYLERLLNAVEQGENVTFRHVELVYIDENEIVKVNQEHLNKDYVTDTISFRYDDGNDKAIEGTLYNCAPRIMEQSKDFASNPSAEFYRVYVHGLLHLAGHDDASEDEKQAMTDLENRYLDALNFPL